MCVLNAAGHVKAGVCCSTHLAHPQPPIAAGRPSKPPPCDFMCLAAFPALPRCAAVSKRDPQTCEQPPAGTCGIIRVHPPHPPCRAQHHSTSTTGHAWRTSRTDSPSTLSKPTHLRPPWRLPLWIVCLAAVRHVHVPLLMLQRSTA